MSCLLVFASHRNTLLQVTFCLICVVLVILCKLHKQVMSGDFRFHSFSRVIDCAVNWCSRLLTINKSGVDLCFAAVVVSLLSLDLPRVTYDLFLN